MFQSRARPLSILAGLAAFGALASAANAAPLTTLARPSEKQIHNLEKALGSAPPPLKSDVAAALPTLRPFVVTLMCVQDDRATQGLVQKFVGSRGTTMFNGWAGANSPAKRIRSHDMGGCLSVTRIQNWKRTAANQFSFDILFTADDSGESYLWNTIVHKEPDGSWLIA